MSAVSVSQEDADRAASFAADARQIYVNGSAVGVTPVTDSLFPDFTTYDQFGVQNNYVKALVLALVRIFKNGPTVYPTQLPSYAKTSLPTASTNTGCMIFVTNESGGAVPAFSDGTNWRRVTDRAIVS
jgi:hypothetical protein